EANLTYTWSVSGPAAVTYSANGSNAAKTTTATFQKAGTYTFTVTIKDAAGLSMTSSVVVTVTQTLTSISVTPATATVATGGTQQLGAAAVDRLGAAWANHPAITWSLASGAGTLSSTGLYTAPTTTGTAVIQASSGTISGTATVNVVVVQPFSAH